MKTRSNHQTLPPQPAFAIGIRGVACFGNIEQTSVKDKYIKSINLQCSTCGGEGFFETDEHTGIITCTKCNRIYNGGYDELVELNQKRINDELELTQEEIQKDFYKEIQNMFKQHGFKIK